jgi:hypothetical protein
MPLDPDRLLRCTPVVTFFGTELPRRRRLSSQPWYLRYEELSSAVADRKDSYHDQIDRLGASAGVVTDEVFRDITGRIVHESNWQEGIHLDRGRTRELLDEVFDEAVSLAGPRLDFAELLTRHRRHVYHLKRRGASVEEVAAFNLSRAHHAIHWIGIDLANRHSASMLHVLRRFVQSKDTLPPEAKSDAARALELVATVESSQAPVFLPLKDSPSTEGDLAKALVELDFSELHHP